MEVTETHQSSSQGRQARTQYEFCGCVEQIPVLANLLKSIAFTHKVNVGVMPSGLRFTVEEGKYIQASVTINRDIFDEFCIPSDDSDVSFKIPFKELLDCLKFFCSEGRGGESTFSTTTGLGRHSSLKLMYKSYGSPLKLLLDENGVVTDFQIKTEPFAEDLMEFAMEGSVTCKLILVSEQMSDLLAEFESNNPGMIRIAIIPDQELRLCCDGIAGIMTCSIPYNSEMVQGFECLSECHVSYKFSMLRHTFRAMNMSQTMSIKIDSNGILCLTFLMATKTDSFVEFFCLPNSMEEEELGFE